MSERAMKVAREIVAEVLAIYGLPPIGCYGLLEDRAKKDRKDELAIARASAALDAFQPEWLERDRVWCQALIETLPAELIHAVTARMMELRPDQPVPPKDATGPEWLDISTAPKDGTPIIVPEMRGKWCLPRVVSWRACPLFGALMGYAFRPIDDGQRALDPTHYMLLPAPPPKDATDE